VCLIQFLHSNTADGAFPMSTPIKTKYDIAGEERSRCTDRVLNSPATKKVVVAGAGTGKTFLFKQILSGKENNLTLTFINALVEDLDIELRGLTDVRTLHGFARGIMATLLRTTIKISPLVTKIIDEDASILLMKNIAFDRQFNGLELSDEDFEFYKLRRIFYGHYSYSAIIYLAVLYFRKNPEKIPLFGQVLVDEFQDFNPLEVELIRILEKKSPILVAGDDDQALYDFKAANPKYLRELHNDRTHGYTSFNLPYCSRCTEVIVDATNDVITNAKKAGFLSQRIDKPYLYFHEQNKSKVCEMFPKITHSRVFHAQIPWYVETKSNDVLNELKATFSVLIISPYNKQLHKIASDLRMKGFRNVECSVRDESDDDLFSGLRLLIDDFECNLGWRIVLKHLVAERDFRLILNESHKDLGVKLYKFVEADLKKEIKELVSTFRKLSKNQDVSDEAFQGLIAKLEMDPISLTKSHLIQKIATLTTATIKPGLRNIPIKLATIQSSKGLSGDVVFLTHFDDSFYIKKKAPGSPAISDQEICNFIVALTRTKKKAFLISTREEKPTFLSWIRKERIENSKFAGPR